MTVSSSTNRVSYSGNGTLTVFAYTFKVFDESDLTVILRASDGTETVQTITTHYTVSGVGDVGGGNITFVTAPTATQTVVILREQPLTQGLDLVPNDPFPAESLEESFDKLTFMVQQHEEELGRAIKASRTNTITTTEFVESASDRANKVIAFDGSGDLDLTQEIGTFQGDWAASTAYAVRDIVKDTNNNNIYIANTAHTSSGTVPLTGNADIAKWDLLVDAAAATTSANNAATSATAAATSATAAATSATAAATSESNAATSASNASTSETNAAASATNAATSESNAAGSESAAATSESNAATSATNASTSASAAATSATNAATSETAAAASQAAAATSETNAATSATSAATNATNAATSASNASTAQTAAETAQTAAEAAQAAAELAADNFDDTYLGSKSSDPTVDNDGGALNAGDLYFNTTSNTLKVYSGSAWQDAAVDSSGFVQTTGDTMTGDLDIQGTLTSDGLTVNTGADNLVATFQSTDAGAGVDFTDNSGTMRIEKNSGDFRLYGNTTTYPRVISASSGGDISFYEDTGTTAKFFWDASAESLGIGTTSPDTAINIGFSGADQANTLRIEGSNGSSERYALDIEADGGNAKTNFKIGVGGGAPITRMTIDSSGNVGIGTSSPEALLHVDAATNKNFIVQGGTGDVTEVLNYSSSDGYRNLLFGGSVLRFETGAGGGSSTSERMRIDSSGNVLVGKTSSSTFTAGNELRAGGLAAFTRSGSYSLNLNRLASDGDIAVFQKDNTTVGSIGAFSGRLLIGTDNCNLFFNNLATQIEPRSTSGASSDGVLSLGQSGGRFKDLYLSGGVYLGGTGAANKLDDYETGYHQTTIQMGSGSATATATNDLLRYTIIGNMCFITGNIGINSVSSPSGTFSFTVPFAVDTTLSETSERAAGTVHLNGFTSENGSGIGFIETGSAVYVKTYARNNPVPTSACEMHINIFYPIA